MMIFPFSLKAREGQARTAVLKTSRGDIRTPAFMPVGTAATVKGLLTSQVRETGADILLTNTYHLMLRPGSQRLERLGGVHKFMRWEGPILSDSGGYQVFSLSKLRRLEEEGVTFRSHLDGSQHVLTPERAMMIQADHLGVDIAMQLDECTPYPCTYDEAARSMELSLRWAKRSRTAFGERENQTLFGIVQGSVYPDLRQISAEQLIETGFGGYAIGGLAVGEGHNMMCEVLSQTVPFLPEDRPRYLMGVGKPLDIVEAVARGVDMFDCVLPTRSGRHGQAWADEGPLNLKNACFAEDDTPLDPSGTCSASQDYSKAYLHHLVKSGELLGSVLLSWHNLAYFQGLMARMRAAILKGEFAVFYQNFKARQKKPG